MGRRRQARENALHALYVADFSREAGRLTFAALEERAAADVKTARFSKKLFQNTLKRREKLDGHIEAAAVNWTLKRMAAVDRNILRMAAYELIYEKDTPVEVVIDEAIEIARKFSTQDSTAFINGILDKLKSLRET